jgi:hypothetical protein
MITLGVILLIIGFIARIPILWSLGILLVVIGAILELLGMAGRAVGRRRHYYWSPRAGPTGSSPATSRSQPSMWNWGPPPIPATVR